MSSRRGAQSKEHRGATMNDDPLSIAGELIAREAHCLDRRLWDEWLGLYADDAVFWAPTWKSEDCLTDDPARELSLIYYDSRRGLEERVARIRSGHSVASTPLPRTVHIVSGILASRPSDAQITAAASWTVNLFHPRNNRCSLFFGLYDYVLVRESDAWKVGRKKVTLMNDYIPTSLDVYCI
jgi:3-phenylpropionate/cinnamic acid dioxygenase small subunit